MDRIFASGLADQVFFRCVEDCFEPIMITDRKGKLRYVNPAWSLTYGFAKEEAIDQTPRLLRSEYQDDEFYKKMWQTILDPKIGFWRGEVVNKAKDGHLVPVLLTITPYREASGTIVGYMGIAVDLTDQKRMEQQILRQDRLASIGMLAGGLAHEIGNPLGVISGRAELLMMQVKDIPQAARNLDVIVGQIDRISRLIQSLLRVSRIPDKILLREVKLQPIASEVAVLVAESCRRANIDLRLTDLEEIVLAEPSHLQQILLNLVLNATHAIQEQCAKGGEGIHAADGGRHVIEISASCPDKESCALSVRDTGIGIPPANLKKLFQPFFTTKAAGHGTGMGLAIVSKLVDEMQGSVFVDSPGTGQGATFTILLKRP